MRAVLAAVCLVASAASADESTGPVPAGWHVRATAELGQVAVLSHEIQFSRTGTAIDYVKQGGQDNLFPFARLSVDVLAGPRHGFTLLYQPLALDTTVALTTDIRVDDLTIERGTPTRFFYGFPFARGSYLYDLAPSAETELSIGGSLQVRNARLEVGSLDGEKFRSNRDVGPVPLLKVRGSRTLSRGGYVGFEVDGTYASIKGLNGSDNSVTGALLDASIRAGLPLRDGAGLFVNLRYLGGGAEGQGDPEEFNDGYTRNWLHVMSLTLGATLDLL